MNDISFPITLDSFCEMAERIAGQPVSDDWREVYRSVVPIINDSYRLGLSGEPRKPFDVESVVRKVAHLGDDPFARRFALSLEHWCELAYSCGKTQYHHIPHPHIEARIHTAAAPACPLLSGVGIPAPCPASARLPSGRSRRNGTPHRSVGRRCIAGARSHLGHLGWDGRDMPLSSGPQKSWVSFIPFCQSLHDFEHRAARTSRIEQHIPRTLIFDAFCLYCRLAITRHQQWAVF